MLVDEDANSILLRFYLQHADPAEYRVVVQTPPGSPDTEFAKRVRGIVETGARPWSELSATVAEVVAQRNRDLAELIAVPDGATK